MASLWRPGYSTRRRKEAIGIYFPYISHHTCQYFVRDAYVFFFFLCFEGLL